MEEAVITTEGEKLIQLCKELIAGEITASFFCDRVDEGKEGSFSDKVSEWEYDHLLDGLLYGIEMYEPDVLLRVGNLYYDDEKFIEVIKLTYVAYQKALQEI
jgi:hypothetical protein